MKALTLWQPWAQLVAWGHKSVETRCWTTKYRGPLAIHAAQRLPPDWLGASRHSKEFRFELSEVLHEPETQVQKIVESLPRGCVLAVVQLVDIVPTSEICDEISQRERIFGNYEDGRYAWFPGVTRTLGGRHSRQGKSDALELGRKATQRQVCHWVGTRSGLFREMDWNI